ncbi:MAG: hypothetical protein WBD58_04125 [Geitlerinemataceae cyanobacterium]
MNASQKDSQIAHLDVTYVPDASLSDANSWSAWQTNAIRSNTTQAYVRQSSSTGNNTNSSANSGAGTSNTAGGNAVSIAPTQKLWKGESWSDGITIGDPQTELESDRTANGNFTSGTDSELTPNLLPNFWEEGSRRAPVQQPNSPSLQMPQQSSLSSKKPMTVISVPVTIASPSNAAIANLMVDSSLNAKDSSFSNMFPLGFLIPSVVSGFAIAGVGYSLLKRGARHSQAEFYKSSH